MEGVAKNFARLKSTSAWDRNSRGLRPLYLTRYNALGLTLIQCSINRETDADWFMRKPDLIFDFRSK
jgi:hypothetical protein